jgi:hypothetical protein
MRKWKYVGPHDAVDIAGVGTVNQGDEFEADLDLDGRPDFEVVDEDLSKLKVEQLRARLDALGIDHAGMKKPELIKALTAAADAKTEED